MTAPTSQIDPYSPEPSNEAPVMLRLRYVDDGVEEVATDQRVLQRPHLLVICKGHTFIYRGTDGVFRLYREALAVVVPERIKDV